jgi:ribosomal protein S18 acetylase RimI-like enzyme
MPESFIIRKYQSGDLEDCRALWRELVEWHREIYQDPTIGGSHPEEHFDKHLAENGSDLLWVAVDGSKVVGLMGLIVKGNEAEMEPLIVSRAYRHKRTGEKLVSTAINEVRTKGIRFLKVAPVARNTRAIEFYYKQGFTVLGSIELFMDFSEYQWKKGPKLCGSQFNY